MKIVSNAFIVFVLSTFSLVLTVNVMQAQENPDVYEIVDKADQKMRGKSSKGKMRMKIVRPNWTRTIEMRNWSKGDEYFMVYITAPAKEKGQAFLKRKNEMWQWQPSIERMIKLPPSMMMQSWMGSDFTNDDLMKESSIVKDYKKELIGEEKIKGYDAYKIKLTPKPEAAVVWGKIITWITKDNYYQLKSKYYDEFGKLVQTMKGSEIETLDNRKLPTKVTMIPADKKGHKTILKFAEMDFNIPIETSFFSQQKMKRLHY